MLKAISKTIKNEANIQRAEFGGMLLGSLVAHWFRNEISGIIWRGVVCAGKVTIRAGENF